MKIRVVVGFAIVILLACYCSAQSAPAQQHQNAPNTTTTNSSSKGIDPQKKADIRKLMELTGAANLGLQMMDNMQSSMTPLLEQSLPPGSYRPKLIELFFQKFRSQATPESLIVLVLPIYDRYFADDELKQLIAFYQTPIGQKSVKVLPQVVSEAQRAGAEWGQELGKKSMEEVLTEHPELKEQLEKAAKAPSSD